MLLDKKLAGGEHGEVVCDGDHGNSVLGVDQNEGDERDREGRGLGFDQGVDGEAK